jgi:hypothetical protein
MRRRQFLGGSTLLLSGAPFVCACPFQSQPAPAGADLRDEMSTPEIEIVGNSAMAKDLDNFFGKGFSCAESGLAVALRYLKKPGDLVWVAGAFGGGLNHRDLCGFLTAGEMAIGIYSGDQKLDRKAAKEVCTRKSQEFWQWWVSVAPIHCAEIREGRTDTDFRVCQRLGKLAAAKIEDLIRLA